MSKISISMGNEKIGKIPSFSMPPVASCNSAAVCGDGECGSYCYALNLYRRFPNVRAAYDRNFEMWKNSPSEVIAQLDSFFNSERPNLFRWFVSGDIPDQLFLTHMIRFAKRYPEIRFLTYTKRDILIASAYPYIESLGNLSIILSDGKNWHPMNPYGMPVAFVDESGEHSYSGEFCECKVQCSKCKKCFNPLTKNVVFRKH